MANPSFAFTAGTDFAQPLQVTTDGVTPSSAYLSTDVLTARVWLGQDQPTLFAPTPTWINAAVASYLVTFAGVQTAALLPGTYYLQVLATRGSQTVVLYTGSFTLGPAPGTAAALASYCSYRDMLRFAPWVGRLQSQTDLAGFAQERQDAKDWFDDLLQRHYRGGSGISPDFYFVPGISFATGYYDQNCTIYRSGARSPALAGWLATGGPGNTPGLMCTSEVIKANAAYAIAQVAKGQIVPGNDKTSAYAGFYQHFEALAQNTANLITAELDTDNDGKTDTYIKLGIADTLEG